MSLPSILIALSTAPMNAGDPVSMSMKGYIECISPNDIEKTCDNLAYYKKSKDGSIVSYDLIIINRHPPVIMNMPSKVYYDGRQMCSTTTESGLNSAEIIIDGSVASDEDSAVWRKWIKERAGAYVGLRSCIGYSNGLEYHTKFISIGNFHATSKTITVRWIRPEDGYTLYREEPGEVIEQE